MPHAGARGQTRGGARFAHSASGVLTTHALIRTKQGEAECNMRSMYTLRWLRHVPSRIETLVALSDLPTLREEAQEAEDDERYEEALALYERLLQAAPTDQNALERKAHVLVCLGRNEEAIVAIDIILATGCDDSTTAWLLRLDHSPRLKPGDSWADHRSPSELGASYTVLSWPEATSTRVPSRRPCGRAYVSHTWSFGVRWSGAPDGARRFLPMAQARGLHAARADKSRVLWQLTDLGVRA